MKLFSSAILAKLILDYRKDNKVNYERQIWEKAYKMLDESQDFFLMDVFTFNDFIKKEFAEKVDPIYIGKEFAEKILEKRKKDPNVEIYLILDENNTFYGAFDNETHEKLPLRIVPAAARYSKQEAPRGVLLPDLSAQLSYFRPTQ